MRHFILPSRSPLAMRAGTRSFFASALICSTVGGGRGGPDFQAGFGGPRPGPPGGRGPDRGPLGAADGAPTGRGAGGGLAPAGRTAEVGVGVGAGAAGVTGRGATPAGRRMTSTLGAGGSRLPFWSLKGTRSFLQGL